jgi:hypothetical protein
MDLGSGTAFSSPRQIYGLESFSRRDLLNAVGRIAIDRGWDRNLTEDDAYLDGKLAERVGGSERTKTRVFERSQEEGREKDVGIWSRSLAKGRSNF